MSDQFLIERLLCLNINDDLTCFVPGPTLQFQIVSASHASAARFSEAAAAAGRAGANRVQVYNDQCSAGQLLVVHLLIIKKS